MVTFNATLCLVYWSLSQTVSRPNAYRETSNISHQILKLKCFLSRFSIVFAQSIEAKC